MTIFVELLDRSINVDVILSTIDLPPVIVPLASLEIPTLERLRSPASRCFENRLEHSIRLCTTRCTSLAGWLLPQGDFSSICCLSPNIGDGHFVTWAVALYG